MQNNNQHADAKAVKKEVEYVLLHKDYLITLANYIQEMRKELKGLTAHIEERERLLTAIEVKYKYDIGRDLLAHYRKMGLKYVKIGRKYFYKSSDIIEFARKAMNQKYENKQNETK